MATFHPFARLPLELRIRIWKMTVEPRAVEVRFKTEFRTGGTVFHVMSSTPMPGILQACHEARNLDLYRRAFAYGDKPRYVWVNFKMDMISIGDTDLREIVDEQRDIRRLRFERQDDEWLFHFESKELKEYTNLEELHVVCLAGFFDWLEAWECVEWSCPEENVRFIDKESGQMIDGYELDKMWDDFVVESKRKEEEEGGD
ncbi:hypothetical protein B0J13DRAFT_681806 [Dactylonectria estremocensis]|uniref:2EXR domain-containing protein n=1 Tax=Dactylonectria estremocensis TaxID=1079267 RepID=A0A9P9D5S4_9HYPO|nr:hypothetical protein B0J13DRAFT_681806 [Dactylonectria estremocensis]